MWISNQFKSCNTNLSIGLLRISSLLRRNLQVQVLEDLRGPCPNSDHQFFPSFTNPNGGDGNRMEPPSASAPALRLLKFFAGSARSAHSARLTLLWESTNALQCALHGTFGHGQIWNWTPDHRQRTKKCIEMDCSVISFCESARVCFSAPLLHFHKIVLVHHKYPKLGPQWGKWQCQQEKLSTIAQAGWCLVIPQQTPKSPKNWDIYTDRYIQWHNMRKTNTYCRVATSTTPGYQHGKQAANEQC